MQRIYELTFILNTSLDESAVEEEIKKINDVIKAADGETLEVQHLGPKKMSYAFKKQQQGNYITIYYRGGADLPKQIENSMKLNESILRSMTLALKPKEYRPAEKEPSAISQQKGE